MDRRDVISLIQYFDNGDEEFLWSSSNDSDSGSEAEIFGAVSEALCLAKGRNDPNNFLAKIVPNLSEEEFIINFRVSRALVLKLSKKFLKSEQYSTLRVPQYVDTAISPDKHILTFLWFAGHNHPFRCMADKFKMSLSSLHEVVSRVQAFLVSMADKEISWPSKDERHEIMRHFEDDKGIPRVVGAVGKTHIMISKPSVESSLYLHAKDFYSVVIEAVCDHNWKFRHVNVSHSGSCYPQFEEYKNLPNGTFLVGDRSYANSDHVITPFLDNGHLNEAQLLFNSCMDKYVVHIEDAFTVLKQRFMHLNHVKLRGFERISQFVKALCVLHNMADVEDLRLFADKSATVNLQPPPTSVGNVISGHLRNEICKITFEKFSQSQHR
ncbi:uncharacterized protein LOC134541343 isoform X2 [Bacillus rossius redtenbacheri]|uniref:uncharacterized protein LOC134541343 isoform X2 n=1 Tax=Bacillus rossius redtenbacheri TaxID=93214 RepID=UPI002FDDE3FF